MSSLWKTFDDSLSDGSDEPVILVDGDETEVHQYLGGGGSKEVYDVEIDGEGYALGLLKFSDPEEGFQSDFWEAPSEPEFIDRARDSDIPTYDVYERACVEIDGKRQPAFLMTRDQDHEYPVYDSKDGDRNHTLLNDITTRDQLLDLVDPMATDISGMIGAGIPAGLDSFNICEIDGEPRVFYTDPPAEEIQDVNESEIAGYYSDYALVALVNTAEPEAFRNDAVENLTDRSEYRDSVENYLKQRAMEEL